MLEDEPTRIDRKGNEATPNDRARVELPSGDISFHRAISCYSTCYMVSAA